MVYTEIKSMLVGSAHDFCNLDYLSISGAAGGQEAGFIKRRKINGLIIESIISELVQ